MPAPKRISERQTQVLLENMEANKPLAKGRISKVGGPLGKVTMDKEWEQLATKLNCVGSGSTKSAKEWRIYWNNLKYKVRAKASAQRRHMSETGGGPAWEESLTEEEARILAILGKENVFGEESVRIPFHDPHNEPTESPSLSHELHEETTGASTSRTPAAQSEELLHDHSYETQTMPDVPQSPAAVAAASTLRFSYETQIMPDVPQSPAAVAAASTSRFSYETQTMPDVPQSPAAVVAASTSRRSYEAQTMPNVPQTPATVVAASTSASTSTRSYVTRPPIAPDVPEWARIIEERNLAAQERTADALEKLLAVSEAILRVLNERLPRFQYE